MRCFKHPKSEAVGICSSCNKGVCTRCAVEKDGKVYCKDCVSKSKFAELKCANHPRSEAVGICSSCNKPICEDCAIDKEGKLYCRLCSAEIPEEFEPPKAEAVEVPQRKFEEKRIPVTKVELSVKPSETVSSTIVGGIFGGFMMGLPFINFLLFWSAVGGALAVYLLRIRVDKYGRGYVRLIDAAVAGAISGVFSAFIATTFNIIYAVLLKNLVLQAGSSLLSLGIDVGVVDLLIKLAVTDLTLPGLFILIKLVATIVLFALLGAIGGALSSELSRR
jgi:hypothetical protein